MSSPSSSSSTTPLLNHDHQSLRQQSLREAARFLRRASSRRMMREPSILVREAAAEQLEDRQSGWAYSKPVVILDVLWNFAFIVTAIVVLILSKNERPMFPLNLWVVGYALQCVVHVGCVWVEFMRRRSRRGRVGDGSRGGYVTLTQFTEESTGTVVKHLDSASTMFSFIWWILGFYWVSAGGKALAQDSPQLYWLCIIFLAFDVFFVIFCVALACLIGIAVCCCLPCIIAILYAVADQEGATKDDIEKLCKYKFRRLDDIEKLSDEIQRPCGVMTECGTDSPLEHEVFLEDAECCICLSAYDDGVELRELPCGHHFHGACVDKWLHINATCPLCKYNILKSSNLGSEEV